MPRRATSAHAHGVRLPGLEAALDHAVGRLAFSVRAWPTIASGAGRRPASQVRNVSSATPRAVAHSAWERPSRIRISLRAEAAWPSVTTMPSVRPDWKRMDCDENLRSATARKWARNCEKYFSW